MAPFLLLLLLFFLALLPLLHGLLQRLFLASAGLVVGHRRDAARARAGGHGCLTGNVWLWRRDSSLRAAQLHARQGVWGLALHKQFRTTPAFPRVKHESAAVDESRLRAIGLMRTALACTKSQSEARLASVGKTLAPVFLLQAVWQPHTVCEGAAKAAKDQPCTKCQGRTTRQNTAPQGLPQPWAMPPPYRSASTPTRPAP